MKQCMMPIWGKAEELQLEAKNISVNYGQVKALEDVSFAVNAGEIVAMIGPNGAGKSTALKAVFGMLELKAGDIFFNGESIRGLRPDEHVAKGISLIPEGRRLFQSMTVIENLEMGAFSGNRKNIKAELENILDIFPLLKDQRKQKAGILSTGEQQVLAMGRALIQKPALLLADEPSLGLSPMYVDVIFEKMIEINKSGTSILLVEQNARMALEISHRGYVFKNGMIFLEDTGNNLLKNDQVEKLFLGG
jgi:branched-chain amino acid transport system ATP-binding protein